MDHSSHHAEHDHYHNNHHMPLMNMDDGMGDMGNSTDNCMSSGMHGMGSMAFHWGYCETILFSQWKISSVGGLVGSMIGIMLMAAIYEGLKYYREYLFWKTYNSLNYKSMRFATNNSTSQNELEDNKVVQPQMLSLSHGYQTILHVLQMVLAYFLMLIFMTYNAWLCIAVVAGAATGYFLFGWKKSVIVDVTEHCH